MHDIDSALLILAIQGDSTGTTRQDRQRGQRRKAHHSLIDHLGARTSEALRRRPDIIAALAVGARRAGEFNEPLHARIGELPAGLAAAIYV